MNMVAGLEHRVLQDKIPFLGICIGMQILFEFSEEGNVPCLGWLKGRVKRFDDSKVRVPQMGWNEVIFKKNHRLVEDLGTSGHFYYVNSYHVVPENSEDILAVTDYDGEFCCMVQHENIFAAQFHAEKSGPLGLKIIENGRAKKSWQLPVYCINLRRPFYSGYVFAKVLKLGDGLIRIRNETQPRPPP